MNLPTPDRQAYLDAKPFPNLVLDNVMPIVTLHNILYTWPKQHENEVRKAEGQFEKAFTFDDKFMPKYISDLIKRRFQSQEFIGFLEELTGFKGLVMDCRNPGLHETFPGGYLEPHLDYIINPATGLQHRVNAILYLNENWKEEYNGKLDLYQTNRAYNGYLNKPEVSIMPIFNRMAIFNITETSWHGHIKPLACPEGMSRKSIALNYFNLPDPDVTQVRTVFQKSKVKRIAREVIPPFMYKLLK